MGETLGYVTRSYNSKFIATLITNTPLGEYSSSREAMKAVEGANGGRLMRWTRTILEPQGEVWRGDDPAWWPPDLGEDALALWLRADRGITLSPGTAEVTLWNSIDGARLYTFTATAPSAPNFVAQGANLKPTVRAAEADILSSNFATLTKPFTVAIAAQYVASAALKHAAFFSTLLRARVTEADGLWEWFSNTSTVVGPAASAGIPDVLTAVVTATDTFCYANGALFGSTTDEPVGAIGTISLGSATEGWSGFIPELVVVNQALVAPQLTWLNDYLMHRYRNSP